MDNLPIQSEEELFLKKRGKRFAAFLSILAAASAAIYAVNKIIIQSATAEHLLKKDSSVFAWRFGNVKYTKTGKGSPLLLLHELSPCSSSYEWHRILSALSTRHTVYCVDLPGCGLSDKQNITYTNFYYVQFLVDFTKSVIGSPTDILAAGLSSSFAITACSYEPKLFHKLILINPTPFSVLLQIPSRRRRIAKAMLECPLMGTLLYHLIVSRRRIQREFEERLFFHREKVKPEYVNAYYESSHTHNSSGKYLMSSIIGNYIYLDIRHALRSIDQDIVILGSSGQEYMGATLSAYQEVNPAVETVMIPEASHLPQLEAPEKLLEHLKIYL